MKKLVCQCSGCKAKFEGLADDNVGVIACPSCKGNKVEIIKEEVVESGCGGCQGCQGCHN